MVILQSHRTQNMILRCYPNVANCYTSETYQILSPVLFQQSLYFLLLIHRIFYLLVYYITSVSPCILHPCLCTYIHKHNKRSQVEATVHAETVNPAAVLVSKCFYIINDTLLYTTMIVLVQWCMHRHNKITQVHSTTSP